MEKCSIQETLAFCTSGHHLPSPASGTAVAQLLVCAPKLTPRGTKLISGGALSRQRQNVQATLGPLYMTCCTQIPASFAPWLFQQRRSVSLPFFRSFFPPFPPLFSSRRGERETWGQTS